MVVISTIFKLRNLYEFGSNSYGRWTKNNITGEIIQRGFIGGVEPNTTVRIKLPIQFTDVKYNIIATVRDNGVAVGNITLQLIAYNLSEFEYYHNYGNNSLSISWIAIGV